MLSICLPVSFFLASASLVAGCSRAESQIIDQKCGTCHPAEFVYKEKRTADEWLRLLNGMKQRGLVISPQDEEQVMRFLREEMTKEN